ncbi:MAG: hypothetical protein ABR511_03690 [Acidimicrobiales bacterium]
MDLGVEVVPPALAVEPGTVGCMEVRVHNPGADVCDAAVVVAGEVARWSWVHPATCSLAAGADATVAVFFKPPCGPAPRAGCFGFEVRVTPAGATTAAAPTGCGRGTVEVRPYLDVVASIDPPAWWDRRAAAFTLRLENRGNVATSAALAGSDLLGELAVAVEPSRLAVDPGETSTAAVRVEARKALGGKGERRLPFVVTAECEGCSALRADGSFYQLGRRAPAH